MRIVLVTNFNGKGLEKDAELLERLLLSWGHETARAQYDEANSAQYDLAIWLEVFNQHLISLSPRHWIFPNNEWLKPEFVRPIQRHCEKVLAKTRDAEKELHSLFSNVEYIGFMCEDRWDPSVVRQDKALHVGGSSGFKGTNEVISAWREYRYYDSSSLPELTVITNSTMVSCEPTPGVTFHKRVDDAELRRLQNEARFHIMPSSYEGWGHAVHESQSVGAVILTTGAGPMSELKAPFEVPPISKKRNNLAYLHEVSGRDIRKYIPRMLEQPNYEIARMSVEARARFERDNEAFKIAFRSVLEPSERRSQAGTGESLQKPRIALLGNFRPPHSTENDLLWSLRDLGYLVVTFQEDEDRTEDILACAKDCSLLIYISTHGWSTPGELSLDDLWKELQNSGCRTCSFHLDRYWGLNELDGREDRIGTHPFWRTERIFTADGGNQEKFYERLGADRHSWLPPGVVKRDCHPGEYKKELAAEVGFVGAESYHPEYPFRPKLIEFLRGVYGERFRLYQGYRGEALGNVYASCPVFVGDSCFAGARRYFSDRFYECPGRGGFLIVPQTEGYHVPGVPTFEPGNLLDLQDKIDWWLSHPAERESARQVAWRWVRENENYGVRMKTLLTEMGVK